MDITQADIIRELEEEAYIDYLEAKEELYGINETFKDPAYDLTIQTETRMQLRAEYLENLIYDYEDRKKINNEDYPAQAPVPDSDVPYHRRILGSMRVVDTRA